MAYLINKTPNRINIGRTGENLFRSFSFDVSEWLDTYPTGVISMVFYRPDGAIYPVEVNITSDIAIWSPTSTDLAVSGDGKLEIRITSNGVIGKSATIITMASQGLGSAGDVPQDPEPDWTVTVANNAILAAQAVVEAEDARDAAIEAVNHYPIIGENNNWYVWDSENSVFVNTGILAEGLQGANIELYKSDTYIQWSR